MRVGRTESVCPVCLRKLSAEKRTGADGYIYMDKQCPEHESQWSGSMAVLPECI